MTPLRIDFGPQVESSIGKTVSEIERHPAIVGRYPTRWLAVALLDDDHGVVAQVAALPGGAAVVDVARRQRLSLRDELGEPIDMTIAGARYQWINDTARDATHHAEDTPVSFTDRLDAVVTHRFLGIPLFLVAMWAVFKLTTDVAAAFLDWVGEAVSGPAARLVAWLLSLVGLGDTWVQSLAVDGILVGVGAVLAFVPVLVVLYMALAVLEDSGYMARAAFVMDRVMGSVGLQGKSFLPMMVGFGCTVPAIYATRTLESERDRILTALLVPFMSCGARLPVYVLIASVFFSANAGLMVFAMYLLGIVTALTVGGALRRSVFGGGEPTPTIMELPPYRKPTLRSLWRHTWGRTRSFLRAAATIILVTSMVVWLLMAIPLGGSGSFADTEIEDSAFRGVAGAVSPVLQPLGFGSWEATGSLLSGFVAKEVVISTMAQTHAVAAEEVKTTTSPLDDLRQLVTGALAATIDTAKAIPAIVGIDLVSEATDERTSDLTAAIRNDFETTSGGHGSLAGLAFMIFILLYTPCMAAAAAERHELGSRWMWSSILGQTALAWVVAFAVFQGGVLLGGLM